MCSKFCKGYVTSRPTVAMISALAWPPRTDILIKPNAPNLPIPFDHLPVLKIPEYAKTVDHFRRAEVL